MQFEPGLDIARGATDHLDVRPNDATIISSTAWTCIRCARDCSAPLHFPHAEDEPPFGFFCRLPEFFHNQCLRCRPVRRLDDIQ
jgi:hypothetical protein